MRKTHLVLTPVVFVLAVEHRHFCLIRGKKQQIPRRKKAYRRLFRAGAESMTQPLALSLNSFPLSDAARSLSRDLAQDLAKIGCGTKSELFADLLH